MRVQPGEVYRSLRGEEEASPLTEGGHHHKGVREETRASRVVRGLWDAKVIVECQSVASRDDGAGYMRGQRHVCRQGRRRGAHQIR